MAVNLSPLGGAGAQFFTNDGVPLTGGLLYTYLAGTSTPATTYTSSNGITALANPIILDAAGRVPTGEIWLSDGISYKFVLKDSTDVLIATWDGLSGINSNFIAYTAQEETATATAGQTVFNLTLDYIVGANSLAVFVNGSNQIVNVNYTETDSNTVTFTTGLNVGDVVKFSTATPVATNAMDAANVSYTPAGVGAVTTSVQAKLRESVSVKDFGATGDGTTDDTAAFNAAILAVALAGGGVVIAPSDTYKIAGTVLIPSNIELDLGNSLITGNGIGSATALFESAYVSGSTIVTNIGTTLNTHGVFKGSIKNARIQNCGKALNLYNCIDNCEFSNIKFTNCTYAVYADNCFYARFVNLFSRDSASGATNACFKFVNNPNVLQLESIFVTDRVLGFEIEGAAHGLKMLNCSAEQCESGVLVSGTSPAELIGPVMFDTCYFEGINNYGINFDGEGAKWNITIENCWFLSVGIAFKTSSDDALDQVEIRRSNKFLNVVTIVDFTDNPYHGNNTLQLQQNDCTYTGSPASPVGVLPSLPANIYLNKRTNVEATQVQYDYASNDPFIKTKLHGSTLIPFEYEGGAGTVYDNIVPFCTHASSGSTPSNFNVVVTTAIAADPYANMILFSFKITDNAGPRRIDGFMFGNTVYRLDALAYTVAYSNVAGKLVITIGGVANTTVSYGLMGIVRHM
jgi:hypothetical protein